jgi:hypothetical protein
MASRLGAFDPKNEDISEYLRSFGHILRTRNVVVGPEPGPDAGQAAVAEHQRQLELRLSWFISEIGPSAYRILAPVEPDERPNRHAPPVLQPSEECERSTQ